MPDLDNKNLEQNKPRPFKVNPAIFNQDPMAMFTAGEPPASSAPALPSGTPLPVVQAQAPASAPTPAPVPASPSVSAPMQQAPVPSKKPAVKLSALGGNPKDLILKAVLGVLVLLVLLFFVQSQTETKKRQEIEKQLVRTQGEMEAVVTSLAALKAAAAENETLKSQLEQMKTDAANFDKKLKAVSDEKDALDATIKQKEQRIADLTSQLTELQQAKSDLESRMARGKPAVPTETGVDQSAPAATVSLQVTAATPEGKILIVKPASRMAVVNLGSNDGIQTGSVFEIYSPNNDYVAKLVIDEVEDTIAIGKISPESAAGKVKENYIAQLS